MGGDTFRNKVSLRGVGAIASALVTGCPQLIFIHIESSECECAVEDMIAGMFEGVGREVTVNTEYT